MNAVAGFKLNERIHEGTRTAIYRGIREETGEKVIVKLLKSDRPIRDEVIKLRKEFELASGLDREKIVVPLELVEHPRGFALVLEDYGGIALQQLLKTRPTGLDTILNISVQLSIIVGYLHRNKLIHKDIKTNNFIIHPETLQVKLTDFGISTPFGSGEEWELPSVRSGELEGTMAYISPEQTGRVHRRIDYRTDFYSLGVTLYEMFTGRLPFRAQEPAELMHSHIAKQPISPSMQDVRIPIPISEIIMKCLAKNPEDRYQSAYGLQYDLQQCLEQVQQYGHVAPFEIGTKDLKDIFLIPQKLYGREEELHAAASFYERLPYGGGGLILVSGSPGSGKTSYVQEIQTTVLKPGELRLTGKFNELQKHIPYYGFIRAFRRVLRQLLAGPEDELDLYRQRFTAKLKENGRVLAQVMPELEWIIGKQPELEAMPSAEAVNRFHYAVYHFLECLTETSFVTVVLDDLQWADASSIQLLHFLTIELQMSSVLFIAMYRSEEVRESHFLSWLIDEAASAGHPLQLELQPLSGKAIHELLCDTLGCSKERNEALLRSVVHKTGGNPFFVKRLLSELHERKLIYFDYEAGIWAWDERAIAALQVSDQAAGFIAEQMVRLHPAALKLLKHASFIGGEFYVDLLGRLTQLEEEEISRRLRDAELSPFVAPIHETGEPEKYRFLHDKIREYCYSLWSSEEIREGHLQLARMYTQSEINPQASEETLFAAVNHYNFCYDAVTDAAERSAVAALHVTAGKQAMSCAAFASAGTYFESGLKWLSKNSWKHEYELAFGMNLGLMETAFLNGRFGDAEQVFSLLKEHSQTWQHRAAAYQVCVNLYTQMGQHAKAVETGIEGLAAYGIRISPSPTQLELLQALAKVRLRMTGKTEDRVVHRHSKADDSLGALMKLMNETATSAYFTNPNLYIFMMLEIVSLSLKHGHSVETSNGFIAYGLLLGFGMGRYSKSMDAGQIGLELSETYFHRGMKCKVNFTFGVFLSPWKQPLQASLDYLWKSFHYGIESGDLVYAGYAVTYIVLVHDFLGRPLQDVRQELERQILFVQKTRNPETLWMLEMFRYIFASLDGSAVLPLVIGDSPEEEELRLERLKGSHNQVIVQVFYMKKAMLNYLFGEYEEALRMARLSESVVSVSFGLFHAVEHAYFSALAACACYSRAEGKERHRLQKEIRTYAARLRKWARECPENYAHLYGLVQAERHRLAGRSRQAELAYEQAMEAALDHGFTQHYAITAERAALFYREQGRKQACSFYMTAAYQAYEQWGASAKTAHMEGAYGPLISQPSPQAPGISATMTKSTNTSAQSIDFAAVLKATQTVAGEIVMERLLTRLLNILLQTTGASRGVIVVKKKEGLFVEAESDPGQRMDGAADGEAKAEPEAVRVLQGQEIGSFARLPLSVVHYTARTLETMVLNDAASEGIFISDPYIQRYRPHSVLCTPILLHGQLAAIIYLENEMTTHVFNAQKRAIIDIIAGQAVISLEHARWVLHLEERVKERTDEIIRMEESRRNLLSNISHDLGTPLTSIQGYVEAILDGVITGEEAQAKVLKVVHSRVLGIQRLMKDLKQLSRMETGQLTMNKEAYPALELMRQLFSKHEMDAEKAGIRYSLTIGNLLPESRDAEGSEPFVIADNDRIGQVVSNLVFNALRYTPAGGELHVHISKEADCKQLLIKISDTGAGIAEHDVPFVFDRFYRGSKARSSSDGGSGLGLAIAKEIIELHDGQIWVESELEKGSTFYFTLPLVWSEPKRSLR
ncbi:protein kinase domain-containing protein [Paenibacillus turpanensis]|uniref:protein kinase domain-containing protein n=1 Tax=Paenibacillus turpanensis TaxID=2689078 RepID=UPI00140D36BD|nr:AAA family ATPase [Paenibacillus turpanensis]